MKIGMLSTVSCAVVLAACAAIHKPVPDNAATQPNVVYVPTPPPETGSPLLSVLTNVGKLVTMPVAEQEGEVVRLTDNFTRTGLPSDRLRLALMLVLGDASIRDNDRANELLSSEAWGDLSYEALARLALDLVEERRRHTRDRLDASTALEEERKQREELEARLRAVEQIETDMNTREVEAEDASQAEDTVRR